MPLSSSARSPDSIRASNTGAEDFRSPGKFQSPDSNSDVESGLPDDGDAAAASADADLTTLNSKTCSWIWVSNTWTVLDIWTRLRELKWLQRVKTSRLSNLIDPKWLLKHTTKLDLNQFDQNKNFDPTALVI